jgi:hypothetical protein
VSDESATLAEQVATALAPCFNILIANHLHMQIPALIDKRHLPDGMMSIRGDRHVEALAECIEFVPREYELVPASRLLIVGSADAAGPATPHLYI